LKRRLPDDLRNDLLSGFPAADHGICIDATNAESVVRLDKVLDLTRNKIIKTLHIEVDLQDYAAFSYFTIEPQDLQWHKAVFFEMTPQQCWQVEDVCPWGRAIVPPITLPEHLLTPLLFGRVSSHSEMSIVLILSAGVRRIFDSENASGLEYSPCALQDAEGRSRVTDECYVARITHRITETASEIIPGQNCCSQHSTVVAPDVLDPIVFRGQVEPYDFAAVHSVRVKNRLYHYYQPQWFVSRKVLDVLLKHKVPGLRYVTLWLKERFKPVVLS
jgi:hypothetical protein